MNQNLKTTDSLQILINFTENFKRVQNEKENKIKLQFPNSLILLKKVCLGLRQLFQVIKHNYNSMQQRNNKIIKRYYQASQLLHQQPNFNNKLKKEDCKCKRKESNNKRKKFKKKIG